MIESLNDDIKAFVNTFDHSIRNIALVDSSTRFIYANEMYLKRSGYSKEQLLGEQVSILKSGMHDKDFYDKLWESLRNDEIYHAKFINKSKNGTFYCDEQTIIPIAEQGSTQCFLIIGKDSSHEIAAELSSFIDTCEPCTV